MKKLLALIALLAVGCVQSAFAWDLPAKSISTQLSKLSVGIDVPAAPEFHLVLMPTGNISMNPFADLGATSYGYTIDEALLFGQVIPKDATHVNWSNIIGVTAGFYVDIYPWMKGTGPWIAKGELGLIGPDMGTGVVPGIQQVFDFNTGERQYLANLNIPFGLFESSTIVKVF